jgi:FKBP-type peptidyl-prolyl cis-trans isomerase SlyD
MEVSNNSVVTFHYTLTDEGGEVIESSVGSQPLAYLHGHGQIIPGLEAAMHGKSSGQSFSVQIAPEEAYGQRTEGLVEHMPREAFDEGIELKPGTTYVAHTEEGDIELQVVGTEGDQVVVDGNHPLAGMTLKFDIQVTDVRPATDEEVSHGHAHGPHGAHG